MQDKIYKTEAIVIKRLNYGETDKILTLFTPQHGKLICIAKGIRKISSKRAFALELFSQVNLSMVRGRGGMDLVVEAQLLNGFADFKRDFDKIKLAYQFIELVNLLTAQNQEQPETFALLAKALSWLDKTSQVKDEALRRFQSRILAYLGFGLPENQSNQNLSDHIEMIIDRKLATARIFLL